MNKISSYTSITAAKNGETISLFSGGKSMFSLYNPSRDGESFADDDDFSRAGYIVIAGAGSSYHIKALQKKYPGKQILIVEDSPSSFQFLQEHDPVFKCLSTKHLLTAYPGRIKQTILESYNPVFDGNIICKAHRVWSDYHQNLAGRIFSEVSEAADEIKADFSVQSHFGYVWFTNLLKNIQMLTQKRAETCAAVPHIDIRGKKAAIAAAGPSLDESVHILKSQRNSYYIIAADTAVPVLISHGIDIDAFVSIDPQPISSGHFHQPLLKPCTAVIEITANHNAVSYALQNSCSIVFTRNKHPLCALLHNYIHYMPILDAGGGTVTSAATDYAFQCGFSTIDFFGADFSYHHGKPYAKSTYLDRTFISSATRLIPSEQSFSALMYRTEIYAAKNSSKQYGITTPALMSYAQKLNLFIKNNKVNTTVHHDEFSLLKTQNHCVSPPFTTPNHIDGSGFSSEDILNELLHAVHTLEKMTFSEIKDTKNISAAAFSPLAAWMIKNGKAEHDRSFFTALILAKKLIDNYTINYYE